MHARQSVLRLLQIGRATLRVPLHASESLEGSSSRALYFFESGPTAKPLLPSASFSLRTREA